MATARAGRRKLSLGAVLLGQLTGPLDAILAGPAGAAAVTAPPRQGGPPTHTPLMQCRSGPQLRPHVPQLAVSKFSSLQAPLQQAGLPPGAVVQTTPHAPQLAVS